MAHLSLFQLNSLIKDTLDENLQTTYWVIAEISSMQVNQKGHCYLELVEKQGEYIQAKLRANIWSYTYRTISSQFRQATGSNLSVGLKGLFNVSINFHEVYGLSLNVNDIDPNFTIGERSRQREETIKKLEEGGYLELNKTQVLPVIAQRIAVISSSSAAGYEDFINQLASNVRAIDFQIKLFHSVMQGNEAPTSIIDSLELIKHEATMFDVVVIIRGGGSKTDLDAFDDYELCKALATCVLPVISGIGHERDESVVDMVANTPLKTPTAVAEFILSGAFRLEDRLYEFLYALEKNSAHAYQEAHYSLDHLITRLERSTVHRLNEEQVAIERFKNLLQHNTSNIIHKEELRIGKLANRLELVNPEKAFEKGYTLTLKGGKKVNPEALMKGDEIETRGKNIQLKSIITDLAND